ncbi:hypothetical protein D3C81_1415750 [compost metagenome]
MVSGVSQGAPKPQVSNLSTRSPNRSWRKLVSDVARSSTALARGVMASSTGRLIDNNVFTWAVRTWMRLGPKGASAALFGLPTADSCGGCMTCTRAVICARPARLIGRVATRPFCLLANCTTPSIRSKALRFTARAEISLPLSTCSKSPSTTLVVPAATFSAFRLTIVALAARVPLGSRTLMAAWINWLTLMLLASTWS